jgi:nicotinamidase/pyrazinamidase
MDPLTQLRAGDAVLAIDVQNDFCPGGALPIPGADGVVPELNRWIAAADKRRLPVVLSRDWHPEEHPSFLARGGTWPRHCVQDTPGARFHPELKLPAAPIMVSKGARFDEDQHSAFDDTGLALELRRRQVTRLFVGGLALDVCVLATVLDARRAGFEVHVLLDASRATSAEGAALALRQMRSAGAHFETSRPRSTGDEPRTTLG